MKEYHQFYINGSWVDPINGLNKLDVLNPATEEPIGSIALGSSEDVNAAVDAAKNAFASFSSSEKEERVGYLEKIIEIYMKRSSEMAEAISSEMGAPMSLASKAHSPSGLGHFMTALETLKNYDFEQQKDGLFIRKEAIGVVGMITPWNLSLIHI